MTNQVIVDRVEAFSIEQIADSGQAFRWEKNKENDYTGIVNGHVIQMIQEGQKLTINGITQKEYDETWSHYFDLNRDYVSIVADLKGKDEHLDSAIAFGSGIRILNQDIWEMIITFIISGNNNIPRIKKAINDISARYGRLICEENGKKYYSFPSPQELSHASVEDLRACGVGYRDKYIAKTTEMIVSGEVVLETLPAMSLTESKIELKKLMGIGDKVADCILLFSCGKTNAFPVDTWVKKILKTYYGFEKTSVKDVNKFANDYFGEYCGIAQQYLFYYIRGL